MLRIVSQFVEKPALMLLCDNPNCGVIATTELVLSALSPTPYEQQEMKFLTECQTHGWALSMRNQFCPQHVKMMLEAASKVSA